MSKKHISEFQESSDYVILNNPLASPKFIRLIGKGKEMTINDIYTPKIFYEIASQLTPQHLENIQRNQSVVLEVQIKDFLESIGANKKNYKHFIESVEIMQSNLLRWKEGDDIVTTAIVTKSIHNPKTGRVTMYVDSDIAKRILEIKEDGNFSFLKSNVFRLQNAQAIKLYPFFKSWLNKGFYQTDLIRFKDQFGYNTSGYKYWSNLETKVLIPAVEEINERTDIHVSYEPKGTNLDGKRPKVRGVGFRIYKKNDVKLLPKESPTPHEPHIDTQPKPLFDDSDHVSQIYSILKKISIEEKPSEVMAKVMIKNLINELGFQAVKDGMMGIYDSKAKPKSIAFFTVANINKYPDYERTKAQDQQRKHEDKQREQEEIRKQRMIEEIKKEYENAKTKFLQKTFDGLDREQRDQAIQKLWDQSTMKSVYFRSNDIRQPNTYAISSIALSVAFPDGYNQKAHLKQFALKNWDIQIDYDESGNVVLN